MRLIILFLMSTLCQLQIYPIVAYIRPKLEITVAEGQGFIAYLDVPSSFGVLEHCYFQFGLDKEIVINLQGDDNVAAIIGPHDEKIFPFSTEMCGIRVKEVALGSSGTWNLKAVYTVFRELTNGVHVNTLKAQKSIIQTITEQEIGAKDIACTKHQYTRYCKITDRTHQWHDVCNMVAFVEKNSTFECALFNWGQMTASHEEIQVVIKNQSAYSNATVAESTKNTILRCKFKSAISSCRALFPELPQELLIMDGLYNGRYSAYDTAIDERLCALEIPKPYEDNERGLWRIINYSTNGPPTGCLFYVGKSKQEIMENELNALTRRMREVQLYTNDVEIAEMSCTVPFVIDDCYLVAPNGTVYFPDSIKFQQLRLFGQCTFYKMPPLSGIWQCGARGRDYEHEVVQKINVLVKSNLGEVLVPELRSSRGNNVEFLCQTPYGEPISHCAFLDPTKQVHFVATLNSIKTAGHVQYSGRGLHRGECGIKINDIRTADYGVWRCQYKFSQKSLVAAFTMTLREPGIGQATSVGLGVGLTIVVLLVMGIALGTVFYRRRHRRARHSFNSDVALSSLREQPIDQPTPSVRPE